MLDGCLQIEGGGGSKIPHYPLLVSIRIDDHMDPCNTLLIIETGEENEKGMPYRIIEPLHIRLRNGNDDRYTRIQIIAESGSTTITMHPGLTADVANSIAAVAH